MQICKLGALALATVALLGIARPIQAQDGKALDDETRKNLGSFEAGQVAAIGSLVATKDPAAVAAIMSHALATKDHDLHGRACAVLRGLFDRDAGLVPESLVIAALGHPDHRCQEGALTLALPLVRRQQLLVSHSSTQAGIAPDWDPAPWWDLHVELRRALRRLLASQRPQVFGPARDALLALDGRTSGPPPEPEAWAYTGASPTHAFHPQFDGAVIEIVAEIAGAGTPRPTINGVDVTDESGAIAYLRQLRTLAARLDVPFDGVIVFPDEARAREDPVPWNELAHPGDAWLRAAGFTGMTDLVGSSQPRCRRVRLEVLSEESVGPALASLVEQARCEAYQAEFDRLLDRLDPGSKQWLSPLDDQTLEVARELVAVVSKDRAEAAKMLGISLGLQLEAVVAQKKKKVTSSPAPAAASISLRATLVDPGAGRKSRAIVVFDEHAEIYEEGQVLKDSVGRETRIRLDKIESRQARFTSETGEILVFLEPR